MCGLTQIVYSLGYYRANAQYRSVGAREISGSLSPGSKGKGAALGSGKVPLTSVGATDTHNGYGGIRSPDTAPQ